MTTDNLTSVSGTPALTATTPSTVGENAIHAVQNHAGGSSAVVGTFSGGSGGGSGVWGSCDNSSGYGCYGKNTGLGGVGVFGECNQTGGTGVNGNSTVASGTGVAGTTSGSSGLAVLGSASGGGASQGVTGEVSTATGYGVFGSNTASSGSGIGTYGAGYGYSVYADAPINTSTGNALYANGSSYINGNLGVLNTITKGGGGFRIDHPGDPEKQYLMHSFVESPDMKNVYDGVAHADDDGECIVTLPGYFESLNSDYRYQLTAIGGPAPSLHVKSELQGGRFTIAGAAPRQKVCWQLTGIRKDPWAQANRIVVEQAKSADDRGHYLHPEARGLPKEKGIDYRRMDEVRASVDFVKDQLRARRARTKRPGQP